MPMTIKARNGYAKIINAFAKEHLADGLDHWKGQPDMIAMTRGDAKDYRMIGSLLRTKGAKEALELARSLDTAARDCVPDQVWDAMERDEDEEALTRQEWKDEVTTQHIEALERDKASIDRRLEEARKSLGTPPDGSMKEGLMSDHYSR